VPIFIGRGAARPGAISVGIALLIGVPFGLLSGYRGGFIDALISRITDAMLACPFLILATSDAMANKHRERTIRRGTAGSRL
jgi:ABC-type dipeptide/oligopeptide/nickel transport system permease subunit